MNNPKKKSPKEDELFWAMLEARDWRHPTSWADEPDGDRIVTFAQRLNLKTFDHILRFGPALKPGGRPEPGLPTKATNKGWYGHIIEKGYFCYQPNSDNEADFTAAGLELKVTPYTMTQSKGQDKFSAKERLVLTTVPRDPNALTLQLQESHIKHKLDQLLLIFYNGTKEPSLDETLEVRAQRIIGPVYRFSFADLDPVDQEIIAQDYHHIAKLIHEGRFHTYSESQSTYLSACTGGQSAAQCLYIETHDADGQPCYAKRRRFNLKGSYITSLIQKLLTNQDGPSIFHSVAELKNRSFEDATLAKINAYRGMTLPQLAETFGLTLPTKGDKSFRQRLVLKMLGTESDPAEFEKAGIQIKTQLWTRGQMQESISFPTFHFCDVAEDSVETSDDLARIINSTFFIAAFTPDASGVETFLGAQFWRLPYQDIQRAEADWLKIQDSIRRGVKFWRSSPTSTVIHNSLPSVLKDGLQVIHIRPHARQSSYDVQLDSGEHLLRGQASDRDSLPQGGAMTKHCFWLNRDYMSRQLAAGFGFAPSREEEHEAHSR